eukprot:g18625.t1
MEGVTNSAINRHLLSNNLLSDAQFGFRQGHSAPDHITALVQTWTTELNSRGEVRVTALYVKSAFDRVWHQGALAKLESLGIRGQTLQWLDSNLAQRKMVMAIGYNPIIDQKLNWTHHMNRVATRAGQKLGILQQVTHLRTPQILSAIYKAQVRSVMEYSPLAW